MDAEKVLRATVALRDSEWNHGLQTENFVLYLCVCCAGSAAEAALRLMKS